MSKRLLYGAAAFMCCAGIAAVVVAVFVGTRSSGRSFVPLRNQHTQELNNRDQEASRGEKDGAVDPDSPATFAQEQYGNEAYPANAVSFAQVAGAQAAFTKVKGRGNRHANWQEVGPTSPAVPGLVSNAGYTDTFQSGRITAIVVSPNCSTDSCPILIGAAGGGVWSTPNGLAPNPNWKSSSNGLNSNAIGSLAIDPANPNTVYVGTGEPNGSGDSEAGTGLFKSTDGGKSWTVVPGSVAVAANRSIGAVAIDPLNPQHILIGTDVARHGSSSANGGRFTPPAAPKVGLYESTDGGASFHLAFAVDSDSVDPSSANGSDFFRGGVSNIQFDPIVGGRAWFSVFDYGLYRSKTGGGYEQVFAAGGGGSVAESPTARTEFALAKNGSKLRIYVGDATGNPFPGTARLYRIDDADGAAPTTTNLPAVNNWCITGTTNQCSYDMPVASPPGHPDEVWLGGVMQYGEIAGNSNGRSVLRSVDAGQTFTDMTLDNQNGGFGIALHPDNHALAFAPNNPGVAFIGSDGGIDRTDGVYVDTSAYCSDPTHHPFVSNVAQCQQWLSSTPNRLISMNDGLATLQFQSLSVNPNDSTELLGGTQDNGSWSYTGKAKSWSEVIGGDGGQSGIDVSGATRMHTYFNPQVDVNFHGTTTLGWDWIGDVLGTEAASFYIPLISDPKVGGSWFLGQQRVWRTQDNGGDQAFLDHYCAEYTGDYAHRPHPCGDWVPLGTHTLTGTFYGPATDPKGGSYVVATERAPSDTGTLWAGTRRGRIFITKAADASDASTVDFTRIDDATTPTRFPSGIAIDPSNPNHAYVSYSGYDAYSAATGTATGHVFEATYDPATGKATWKNLSYDLGDQPITDVVLDSVTGDLYASTDFGVVELAKGSASWVNAGGGLPPVATYGLTIAPSARILYAATHGRGAWSLDLNR